MLSELQNLLNGGDQCTGPFMENMQNYIGGLGEIGALSSSLDGMTFPIALCGYIDEGKSPDLQMKTNYMVTQSRNNLQRARIVNTDALEQNLKNGMEHYSKWTVDNGLKSLSLNQRSDEKTQSKNQGNDQNEDIDVDVDMKPK